MQNSRRRAVTLERVRGVEELPTMYLSRSTSGRGRDRWTCQAEIRDFSEDITSVVEERLPGAHADAPKWCVVSASRTRVKAIRASVAGETDVLCSWRLNVVPETWPNRVLCKSILPDEPL